MTNIIGRIFRMSSFAAALAVIASLSIFTLPSFAATTASPQSTKPHDSGCVPAVTYSWTYTGSAKANVGGGVKTAEASVTANFKFNGRCGLPSVTYKNCNIGPRITVSETPTNCSVNNTGDLNGDVWVIGDNSVVYSGLTVCTLDIELGSDYYGDYNTADPTTC